MADYRNINIRNKRATFDYEIIEEFIAGIVLVGTEIKSIRLGKASLTDCYCYFDRNELWIRGMNVAEYGWGTCNNHAPKRDRKLLLNRKELNKVLPQYSQVTAIEVVEKEFEKTPKRSIKRFLYS